MPPLRPFSIKKCLLELFDNYGEYYSFRLLFALRHLAIYEAGRAGRSSRMKSIIDWMVWSFTRGSHSTWRNHWTELNWTELNWTALHCTALFCIVTDPKISFRIPTYTSILWIFHINAVHRIFNIQNILIAPCSSPRSLHNEWRD